jgi:uncharacterized protein
MFIQEMSERECFNALIGARLGRLACAHDNQPYVTPIYFVYQEPYLYGFTTPGQKVQWMRSNPLVCVELDEVKNRDQWTSILIFGRYEELPEPPGTSEWDQEQRHLHAQPQPPDLPTWVSASPGQQARLHAHELLKKHGEWWEPGCASSAHRNPVLPLVPVFYRIRIDRIGGRRFTPRPSSQAVLYAD